MRNPRLLNSLLVGLVSLSALSQATGRPKLVVGIVVDQLRTDYIEYLKDLFGKKGFTRLMENGVYMPDVDFGVATADGASGTAEAVTGSYPSYNGIPSATVYDAASRRNVALLEDKNSYTPARLMLSTISDELAVDGIGLGGIYSIAATPEMAVVMGGHAANSAVWIDPNSGRWASSSYYSEEPLPMRTRNSRAPLPQRIDTMQWKPMLDLAKYPGLPQQKRFYPFRHSFPSYSRDTYRMFSTSPLGNREVTDLAIDYLNALQLGRRGEAIDMLNIGYSLAPFTDIKDGDYRLELQDAYLRLDADLGRLMETLDSRVGMENVLLYIFPTGYFSDTLATEEKYRIPTGDFSTKRCMSLLNSFLSAKYGNAEYVGAMCGPQVYFNTKVIEDKRLDVNNVEREARDFIAKMSGVEDVYTLSDILDAASDELQALRRSTAANYAGNLYVKVQAGWNLVDDCNYPTTTRTIRYDMVATPAFIFYPPIKQRTIENPVDGVVLAPTVCRILRIRSPNGAVKRGISLQ
jgi:hypothetical protein